MYTELNSENFDSFIANPEKAVLIDLWATWCGPCRMLAPVVESVCEAHADRGGLGKVDVDRNLEIAQRYRVVSIPMLLLFKGGELVKKSVGYVSAGELEAWLAEAL